MIKTNINLNMVIVPQAMGLKDGIVLDVAKDGQVGVDGTDDEAEIQKAQDMVAELARTKRREMASIDEEMNELRTRRDRLAKEIILCETVSQVEEN